MEELKQFVLDNIPEIYKTLNYFKLPILVEGRLVWFKYNHGEVDIMEKAPAKYKPVVEYNREGKAPVAIEEPTEEEEPKQRKGKQPKEPKQKRERRSRKALDEDDFDSMSMLQSDWDDDEDEEVEDKRSRKERPQRTKSRRESLNEQELETDKLPNRFEDEDEFEDDKPKKGHGGTIVFIIVLLVIIGTVVWLLFLGGMDKIRGNKEPDKTTYEEVAPPTNNIQTTLDLTDDSDNEVPEEDYEIVDDGTTIDNTENQYYEQPMLNVEDDPMSEGINDGSAYVTDADGIELPWSEDFNYEIGDFVKGSTASGEDAQFFVASEVVSVDVTEDQINKDINVSIPLRDNIKSNTDLVLQNVNYEMHCLEDIPNTQYEVFNDEYQGIFKHDTAGKYHYTLLGKIPSDAEVESEKDWENFKSIISQ